MKRAAASTDGLGRATRATSAALWPWAVVAAAIGTPALAQEGASGSSRAALRIEPTLTVTATATDNDRSTSSSGRADLITEITPGVRIRSASGALQGRVDYGLSAVVHARDSGRNALRNRLSADGRAELWRDHLTVDVLASVTQGATSAFGQQVPGGTVTDLNRTEVRSLSVTPALRGVLFGRLQARASASASFVDAGSTGDSRAQNASASLGSIGGTRLGWDLTGTTSRSNFERGRDTRTDRLIGTVIWQPDADWRLSARGGRERSDLSSLDLRDYDNYGAGIQWTPSPRTKLQLDADKRSFGHSHVAAFEFRQRRTVLRLSDTQDVTSNAAQTGAQTIPAFLLYYQLFASQEPDPLLREALVRDFLARNNLRPDTPLGGGFVSSAVALQRRQEASVALQMPRTVTVVTAFSTRSRRADTVSTAIDDLSLGPLNQRGLSVTVTHQLSPVDSLSVSALTQRSASDAAARRGTLSSLSAGWSKRVSNRTNASLTVRHSTYDSATDPYTENAVSASLSTRF